MDTLIKAYTNTPKVTDYKKIFDCTPEDAYMHTFLTSTSYTFCFATQFAKWVSDVQRSIPVEHHRRGILHAVVTTGDLSFVNTADVKDVKFLLRYYNPIVLWNNIDMDLEAACVFYKMIPDELFFKKKGCLEEAVKSQKFEYTIQMDSFLTTPQLLTLSTTLMAEGKKLGLVGPNYLGLVPLSTILATVDLATTVFCSRTSHYRYGISWKRLEVIGPEFTHNDIGPYFNKRTKEVYLPNDNNIEIGPNPIDLGGSNADITSLYKKFGLQIVEQFVNYANPGFAFWFEAVIERTTTTMSVAPTVATVTTMGDAPDGSSTGTTTTIPSIILHQKPDICPAFYQSIYGVEPDWNPKCHRTTCEHCDPDGYKRDKDIAEYMARVEERRSNR